MAYFPFFVDLSGKRGLIVGGGAQATEKAERLLPFGVALTVVAEEISPSLAELDVTLLRRDFLPEDLVGVTFVVIADVDTETRSRIHALCREQRIPVNSVDDTAHCDFIFPSLIQEGDLTVGISTGGVSPTAGVWLKEQIRALLPTNFGGILLETNGYRARLIEQGTPPKERKRMLRAYFLSLVQKSKSDSNT